MKEETMLTVAFSLLFFCLSMIFVIVAFKEGYKAGYNAIAVEANQN